MDVDVVLSVPLFVGVASVAVVALLLLRHTRLFWLPGMALIGYAAAIYVAWPWYDTHEDVGGLEGLSNFLHVVVSLLVAASGGVCLLVGARSRRRARQSLAALTSDGGKPTAR